MFKSTHLLGVAVVAISSAACATRHVPTAFPSTAPAAPDAARAPLPPVGHVVTDTPPLPGEPTTGWPGLDATPAQDGGHAH
jgi:hypothetical protein